MDQKNKAKFFLKLSIFKIKLTLFLYNYDEISIKTNCPECFNGEKKEKNFKVLFY